MLLVGGFSMTYQGKIENGQVVIGNGVHLPEGASVTVIITETRPKQESSTHGPTLLERLKGFVGSAKNLPPDASVNVDHYLYGLPKK
jgi:hypothetical protein